MNTTDRIAFNAAVAADRRRARRYNRISAAAVCGMVACIPVVAAGVLPVLAVATVAVALFAVALAAAERGL